MQGRRRRLKLPSLSLKRTSASWPSRQGKGTDGSDAIVPPAVSLVCSWAAAVGWSRPPLQLQERCLEEPINSAADGSCLQAAASQDGPLIWSIKESQLALLRTLLDAGAEPDGAGCEGRTP